jgi:hypothetical protein
MSLKAGVLRAALRVGIHKLHPLHSRTPIHQTALGPTAATHDEETKTSVDLVTTAMQ